MSTAETLITEHLDTWTSAIKAKSSAGRGGGKKEEFYGIKKLRELILELAVRGLLVPQDPKDEPASELLRKISSERSSLIKAGKLKKQAALPPVEEESSQYTVPKGWVWTRVGTVGNVFNGNSISARLKEEKYTGIEGHPFIATKDVGYGFERLDYENGIAIPVGEERFQIAQKGTVLICAEGGSAGKKCGLTDRDICFGNKLFANELFGGISSKYILSVFLSPTFFSAFSDSMTGIIGGISKSKFETLLCPLPPLAEQHRIVSKVDELMALCDQLEQQQEESMRTHGALVETLLGALTAASEPGAFAEAWQRLASHFDTLLTTESSIDQLKQTILQLAVMGRLVEQNPEDEPAAELLKKIATVKAKLIKAGSLKKQKPLPPVTDNEKPYSIPDGWQWVRLNDSFDIRDGTHDSPKDAIGSDTFPLVTSKDFKNGGIDFESARMISRQDHLKISERSLVEVDDILFSMIGGNIGNQVIVQDSRPFSVKNVALFKYYSRELTSPKFLKIYSEELALKLQEKASGGAQPFISLGALRKLPLALPPTAEQHRIVAKVDELMALCDRLKASLQSAQSTQLHLADNLVEAAIR